MPPRNRISLKTKKIIINECNNLKIPKLVVANKHKLPIKTVYGILKHEKKISASAKKPSTIKLRAFCTNYYL